MKAVILAAGIGSRLRPLTNDRPKTMVQVAGKSILEHQLDAFVDAGVRDIVCVTGYEADAIEHMCRHRHDATISLIRNVDYETTNNMFSLSLAAEQLEGRSFLLCNADVVLTSRVVEKILATPGEAVVAVDRGEYLAESMKVVAREDGSLSHISKDIPPHESHGVSIDLYRFSVTAGASLLGEVRARIGAGAKHEWTEVALDALMRNSPIRFVPADIAGLPWYEVDTYDDLTRADILFSSASEWLPRVRAVAIDLDGTLYRGDELLPGARDAVVSIQRSGRDLVVLSNNSSRARDDYVKRLEGFGITVRPEQIVISTDELIAFLHEGRALSVHVLGTESLRGLIAGAGIRLNSVDPEYVVVGYDTSLTYEALVGACKLINAGVEYIGTHADVFCPSPDGPIPDAGAIMQLLEITTGRRPLRIFGKPSPGMLRPWLARTGTPPSELLVIGDRLHTDIRLARNVGAIACLVLTGDSTRLDLQSSDHYPELVLDGLGALSELLAEDQ